MVIIPSLRISSTTLYVYIILNDWKCRLQRSVCYLWLNLQYRVLMFLVPLTVRSVLPTTKLPISSITVPPQVSTLKDLNVQILSSTILTWLSFTSIGYSVFSQFISNLLPFHLLPIGITFQLYPFNFLIIFSLIPKFLQNFVKFFL